MAFLKRMTHVMTANLHELLDRYECPETMLKQVIREMDDELQQLRSDAIDVFALEKQLTRSVVRADQEISRLHLLARQQLATGQEQAARASLREMLDCRSRSAVLDEQRQQALTLGCKLKQRIAKRRTQRAEARSRLTILLLQARLSRTLQREPECSVRGTWTAEAEHWEEALQLDAFRLQAREELDGNESGADEEAHAPEVEAELAALRVEVQDGIQ